MQIVNIFYDLARQHKKIKSFVYGKSYEKGAGNNIYPLVWLDDPIYGNSVKKPIVQYTVNVDFLGIPANDEDVIAVQTAALNAGLAFNEKLEGVERYSFLSLRDYYDDKAAGFRFTFTINKANPVDRCADEFEPDKQFTKVENLPDFKTDNPNGCAVFSNKKGLPNFTI